jgi:acyl carrier protein
MTPNDYAREIKSFICRELLWGEPEESLPNNAKLITDDILDSLSFMRLVSYLEDTFNITITLQEMNADYLDTVDLMAATVRNKVIA